MVCNLRPVVVVFALLVVASGPALAGETSLGLGLGATAGFGVQGDITFQDFTRDAPLSLRLSGAYSGSDPGNALDARRVFINDNTNGTPEQSASTWQVRLDLMLPVFKLGSAPVQLGVGYFFKSRLEGHDTAYEPDGDDVNPRNDYTWDDADDAVNQPRVEPFGLVGLRIRLGS